MTAHKVRHAELRSSALEQGFAERLSEAGLSFVRQHPVGPYVADLAFPQVRLLVEVDGEAFHSGGDAQARDERRDAFLTGQGWRVVRVPQFMITQHPEEAVRAVVAASLEAP